MADLDNRMVLLTSVTSTKDQDDLNTAGLLVGELALNANTGTLFAGADPGGVGDGSTPKAAGQTVYNAADILGIKLSTASTAQAVGTGNSVTFTGATINDGNLTINNGTTSAANQGGKLILAADDGAVMGDNHRLGVIEFKGAEDTSSTLSIGARIEAIARSAWGGSDNDADLVFYTTDGTTETAALTLDADSKATFGGAVDINSGNIDGATIATSDVTVGSGKTLDVSGGTLTLAADQISGNAINGGTIGATTISTLTTGAINASADIDIGTYSLRATQFTSDIADGTAPFVVTSTTKVANLNADTLDGVSSAGFVAVGGDDMTGDLAMGANSITGVADPSGAQDAATKAYVDATAQGLYIHDAVVVATTAELSATYANGSSGVGATLTNAGTQAALAIDGITLTANERVLVKNQSTGSTQFENGIYQASTLGNGSTNWVLTRVTDFDIAADMKSGAFVFVQEGSTNADSGFVMTQDSDITVGTTGVTWSQFSGAGQITAGSGLTKDGNTLDLTDIADDYVLANTSGSTAAPTGVSAPMIGVITAADAAAARSVLGTGTGTMSDLSDDSSPQLGADLDTNSFNIKFDDAHGIYDDDGNEQILFQKTGSAVTYLEVTNNSTGNGVTLGSKGETNVDLLLTANGSGVVKVDGNSLALGGNLTTAGAITHSGAHAVTLTTTGTTAITLPTSGTLVGTTAAQTLTNKTLTSPAVTGLTGSLSSPVLTTPQIEDTSSNHQYVFAVSELAADRTVTLPLLTGNDTFVFNSFAATLENKTISGGTF